MTSYAETNLVKNINSFIEERIKNGGQVGGLVELMKIYEKDKKIDEYFSKNGDKGLERYMELLDGGNETVIPEIEPEKEIPIQVVKEELEIYSKFIKEHMGRIPDDYFKFLVLLDRKCDENSTYDEIELCIWEYLTKAEVSGFLYNLLNFLDKKSRILWVVY